MVRVIGVVRLCRSVFWTGAQKIAGAMGILALPMVINVAYMNSNALDGVPTWLITLLVTALPLGGCVWLWFVRRRTA